MRREGSDPGRDRTHNSPFVCAVWRTGCIASARPSGMPTVAPIVHWAARLRVAVKVAATSGGTCKALPGRPRGDSISGEVSRYRARGAMADLRGVRGGGVSGLAVPAGAYAVRERSAPTDGAVLGSSPGVVAMVFDEPVGISLGSVMVYDARGRGVDKGGPYHPSGNGKAVSENVPPDLSGGGYVVTWRVVSADSHPVHGAFTFQIGAAGSRTASRRSGIAARPRPGQSGSGHCVRGRPGARVPSPSRRGWRHAAASSRLARRRG
jgi:methionine-rich copper-binding protein CopC